MDTHVLVWHKVSDNTQFTAEMDEEWKHFSGFHFTEFMMRQITESSSKIKILVQIIRDFVPFWTTEGVWRQIYFFNTLWLITKVEIICSNCSSCQCLSNPQTNKEGTRQLNLHIIGPHMRGGAIFESGQGGEFFQGNIPHIREI